MTQITQDGEAAGWRLASAVVNDVLLVVGILSALGALLAQPLVALVVAPGFDAARQALTAD